jgi:iron complex transport system substrate-binding protein
MNRIIALLLTALTATAFSGQITGVDGVTIDVTNPQRSVVLNSSVLEVMYELGLESTIVGTDGSGTWPENKLPSVGHPYNYAIEGLLSLEPDLVISAEENMKPETAAQLRDAGAKVLVLGNSGEGGLEGLYDRIEAVAAAFDVPDKGQALIERIRGEVTTLEAALAEQVPADEKRSVLFIYSHSVADSTIYGGPNTGPGYLITLAGADDAGGFVDAGHVPITSEALVAANPEVLVMLGRGLEAVGGIDGYLKLPGVALTTAGKNRAVYAVDDSVRWIGPRFPQFARDLAVQLYDITLP